ncbi:MAG: hypothetical protein EA369_06410 [Bradymonadales bacterium]|nr:MAG: hypothetical protein EA369_06410 [Bradymonadales bacterium]
MERDEIKNYLRQLSNILKRKNIRGELGIVGGAAMCLAFKARASTKDVDGVFEPSSEVRLAAKEVAEENSLSDDWLNDAAKAFMVPVPKKRILFEFDHLLVWTPEADYLLAMKTISARWDTSDRDDVIFLISFLGLRSPEKVYQVIQEYYPKARIPAKTQFFIDEIFEKALVDG